MWKFEKPDRPVVYKKTEEKILKWPNNELTRHAYRLLSIARTKHVCQFDIIFLISTWCWQLVSLHVRTYVSWMRFQKIVGDGKFSFFLNSLMLNNYFRLCMCLTSSCKICLYKKRCESNRALEPNRSDLDRNATHFHANAFFCRASPM